MRRLMHQYSQTVHPPRNDRYRQEIQPNPAEMTAESDSRAITAQSSASAATVPQGCRTDSFFNSSESIDGL
jgi:hypothetical protein